MASVQTQKDFQFTFEKQAAWDTQLDSTPTLMLTEDMSFSIEPNNHNIPIARGIRGSHESDNWNDLTGVIPTATATVYMTPTMMQNLLPALCQYSGVWAAAANIYDIYAHDTCADFPNPKADDDGYYYTLTRRACQASKSSYLKNAVPTNFTFKISNTDNDQILVCDTEWIGQGYTRATSPTGTVTTTTLSGLHYTFGNIGVVSWGAYDLTSDFKSAEISATNGAAYVDDLPTGPVAFNGWEVTGNFVVAAGSNTEAMKALCESDDADNAVTFTIAFGDGTVSSAGEANITVFGYLNSFEENFESGETITFNFRGVFGASPATENPLRVQFYEAS